MSKDLDITNSNALPISLKYRYLKKKFSSHYIFSHPILDFLLLLFYLHKRNELESHWHQKFLIHGKPFYKHFSALGNRGKKGGQQSLERLLGSLNLHERKIVLLPDPSRPQPAVVY